MSSNETRDYDEAIDGPLFYEPEFAGYDEGEDEALPDLEPLESEDASSNSLDDSLTLENEALPEYDTLDTPDAPLSEGDDAGSDDPLEGLTFDDYSDGTEDLSDGSLDGLDDWSDIGGAENASEESPSSSVEAIEFEDAPESTETAQDPDDDLDDFSLDDEEESDEATDEDTEPRDDEDEDESGSLGESLTEAADKIGTALRGGLKKLPIVGKLITSAGRALIAAALIVVIPLMLIIVASAISRTATAPPEEVSIALPDNGGVKMSAMEISDDGSTVTATLANTGDVIATVTPSATLKTTSFASPKSWFVRQDSGTCSGEEVEVDIEGTAEVTLKCTDGSPSAVIEGSLSD